MQNRNLKLLISYDGTNYSGWQRQKNAITVQEILETVLAIMVRHPVTLHGAGRTDAGVHAEGMVANFLTASAIPARGMIHWGNNLLPDDIRILCAEDIDKSFHARYSATSKTYCYQLSMEPVLLPTFRLYWAAFRNIHNIAGMQECLRGLIGSHDFSSFEASGSRNVALSGRGAVRTILQAEMKECSEKRYEIIISGDGFLRHMVRNIVGTLVEVGQGRRTVDNFFHTLEKRKREFAGPTAPAHGLCLRVVHY